MTRGKKWFIFGIGVILIFSILIAIAGSMSLFVPMPIYMVMFFWIIGFGGFFIMPFLYFFITYFFSERKYFSITIFLVSLFISIVNIFYFFSNWNYGIGVQGIFHTWGVAIENIIGFLVLNFISYKGIKNKLFADISFFLLIFLLTWCAFPYLGELP